MKEDKVYWLESSSEDKVYDTTTWYRCVGIEEFVERVEEKKRIVAIIVSDNNVGFILDHKH